MPSGLGNYFVCKRFAVQTLLWSLEFVIQINLKHNTIASLKLDLKLKYLNINPCKVCSPCAVSQKSPTSNFKHHTNPKRQCTPLRLISWDRHKFNQFPIFYFIISHQFTIRGSQNMDLGKFELNYLFIRPEILILAHFVWSLM